MYKRYVKKKPQGTHFSWYKHIGMIGWSITIYTLIAMAVGVLLDSLWKSSNFWKLIFLMAGFITGWFNAWYWFNQEKKN